MPETHYALEKIFQLLVLSSVVTEIFEGFGGMFCKEFITGWKPVLIVHFTRPGTCINQPLH